MVQWETVILGGGGWYTSGLGDGDVEVNVNEIQQVIISSLQFTTKNIPMSTILDLSSFRKHTLSLKLHVKTDRIPGK